MKDIGTATGFKFENYDPSKKIDYIFREKSSAKIVKAEILRDSRNNRYPSDHFPVLSHIQFK